MESNSPRAKCDFINDASAGLLSRREILKRGAALGISMPVIAALLAACAGPEESADEPSDTTGATTPGTDSNDTDTPDTTDSTDTTDTTDSGEETAISRELIGELEGPEIVMDGTVPSSFSEAPMLTEMVEAGDLPPVEERLPSQPMVIRPLTETGQYGGTWRRAFTGPGDHENGNRISSTDKLLFWDYTGNEVRPSVVREWEVNDDGTEITMYLREGMRWSDGEPFTSDDFVFWYEDVYQNSDLLATSSPELSINGQPGDMEAIDDYTIRWTFPEPYPMFVDVLAGSTQYGGGHATRGRVGMGAYAPRHYLEQFHPNYSSEAEVEQLAEEQGYDNWANMFLAKNDWGLNPDLPVLAPWRTVVPNNNPTWELERNPYYWVVDTDGNQLPYFDKIIMTMAESLEVVALRAMAGEIDKQSRHMEIGKLPVFLENQQRGDYKVHLDPALYGTDAAFQVNGSYDGDPEIKKWLTNRDFRRALSLGIERDQLNEAFWLGLGTPGSAVPTEDSDQNPGPEYRTLWSTYDPDQANELLDGIGLTEKDSQGFRLRTDNGERLRIQLLTIGGAFIDFPQIAEMVAQQWVEIGIQADVQQQERSLAWQRVEANDHQIFVWQNDGSEQLFIYPQHTIPTGTRSSAMGPEFFTWYATNGEEGMEPPDELRRAMDMFRSASGANPEERTQLARDIWAILTEECYTIGTVGLSPAVMGVRIVKNNVGNQPQRQANGQHVRTPCTSHPITFFYKS